MTDKNDGGVITWIQVEIGGPPEYPGGLLQQALVVFGDKSNEGQLIEYVATPWFKIIQELSRDPEFLFKVPWRKMEELIAAAYCSGQLPRGNIDPEK